MARNWESGAVKHPGRETRRAKENGVSVHEQLERDAHLKGNSKETRSLRAAGRLGLRFQAQAKRTIAGRSPSN